MKPGVPRGRLYPPRRPDLGGWIASSDLLAVCLLATAFPRPSYPPSATRTLPYQNPCSTPIDFT